MRARIGIVDDHPAITLGVSAIINAQTDMHVVAAAPSVRHLLLDERRFDLVLLDLALADGSTPAENMKRLTAAGAPVLAYTSGDRPELIQEIARSGAIGMLSKSALPGSIIRTIRHLLTGEPAPTPDWASALDSDREFVDAALTVRESEVLALYAQGETAETVAARLHVSRNTVIDHIRHIRAKYAAVDRTAPTKVDLYRRAVEDGLVPPRD